MPPPSYPHRHLLLTGLLDAQPAPPSQDAFAVNGELNERGCKLDSLLLAGWTASARKGKQVDNDVLQHADNLRLKKNDFEVLGRVGEGQFGVVDAVRCKLDGKVYAMKSIEKSMVLRAGGQLSLAHERHVHKLAAPSSPAPVFTASFQSPTALHLVSAFAPCGSLWDRLCEMLPVPGLDTGRMEEDEIAWWSRQMVGAISWIHGVGYTHRDIKPHNFLLLPDARLWLTDFGSAAPLSNGAVPRRYCMLPAGTPDYVAPEILRFAEDAMIEAAQSDHEDSDGEHTIRQGDVDPPGYGPDVDWWSLGATLYEMGVGRAPFFAPSIGGTYDRIMRCDMRMPDSLSPQLKSLLSGLLSPRDVRLGHCDANEIRRHSFFRGVDWSKHGTPPPGIVSQSIDLDTLTDAFDHKLNDDVDEVTFEHFFDNTTMGFTTTMSSSLSMAAVAVPPSTWARWVGWSWEPPSDFFGTEPPKPAVSPNMTIKPLPLRQQSAPPLLTPMRAGSYASPQTVPRTAPRSVPRTRPVSERQAFAELVKCVQASARKKLQSAIKMPGSASTVSSLASTAPTWRKEQPPTPTPMSRDVTVSLLASRVPSKGNSSEEGGRPPRSLSRTSSLQTLREDPPPRPLSRNSARSRDDIPTRPRSQTSTRSSKDETSSFLSRLVAVENMPQARSVSRSSSRSTESYTASAPTRPPAATSNAGTMPSDKSAPRTEYRPTEYKPVENRPPPRIAAERLVPPRDPGTGKGGDRMASMRVWHESLQDGLSSLECRLADMTARLSNTQM